MAVFAYALPIVPGEEQSARSFEAELEVAGFRDRYEELNRAAGLRGHYEWLEELPSGNLLVVAFELDDPRRLMRAFSDTDAYDNWWRERVRRVHGFDPASGGAQLSKTWAWESGS